MRMKKVDQQSQQGTQNLIQLYIQTHKNCSEKAESQHLLANYLSIYASAQNNRNVLLKFLPDFLKVCTPLLSSHDEVIQKQLQKGFDKDCLPYVNVLIQHFCATEDDLAKEFASKILQLTRQQDLIHLAVPLIPHLLKSQDIRALSHTVPYLFSAQQQFISPEQALSVIENLDSLKNRVDLIILLVSSGSTPLQEIVAK